MVLIESVFVTLMGLGIGFAGSLIVVALLADGLDLSQFAEGLMSFGVGTRIIPVLQLDSFTLPAAVAVITALVAGGWPALRAVRFRPADAVRQT